MDFHDDAYITVSNLEEGEERRYPVILVRGHARGVHTISVTTQNTIQNQTQISKSFEAPVAAGEFKVLVELVPGDNHLWIGAGGNEILRSVRYTPPDTIYKVKLMYITADDGDTTYLTQLPSDKQNFREKFDTAVKLLQTFTAEQMHQAGFGYKTFAVEYDENGKASVDVLKSSEPRLRLQTLNDGQLFDTCSRLVHRHCPDERYKKIGIMAFTGYDPIKKTPLGHTALGGDKLALFSCNAMCSWPDDIRDVQRAFNDTTSVDSSKILDDTNNRPRFWALASTSLGVTLHELGHTFGLLHQPDPFSIMSRGFDYFNRVFAVTEPQLDGSMLCPIPDSEAARWDDESAQLLNRCLWFQPDFATNSDVASSSGLEISNLKDGEERSYSVLLLRGFASEQKAVFATVENSRNSEHKYESKVVDGKFKLLIELAPGDNRIRLVAGDSQVTRTVTYRARETPYKVKLVYVTANDGDTKYLTQFEGDKQDYREKLNTAIKLMQSFTAEQMNNHGYGHKTFAFDLESNGKAKVNVVGCSETTSQLRSLGGVELYQAVRRTLENSIMDDKSLVIAITAFTGYKSDGQILLGHTAVGHDRMTVFSCNGMCSWPSSIDGVEACFTDTTPVDLAKNWDDSNGREQLWALASTTIGVNLHLLGFSLGAAGQRQDPFSITARGFDFFNRFFVNAEPSGASASAVRIDDSNTARWDADSAAVLNVSPWFG